MSGGFNRLLALCAVLAVLSSMMKGATGWIVIGVGGLLLLAVILTLWYRGQFVSPMIVFDEAKDAARNIIAFDETPPEPEQGDASEKPAQSKGTDR